jgi:hypothetical protein
MVRMSSTGYRRLEKIAQALSPQQAVLLWMAEAHQYPTLAAYMDALKDAPITQYPMMHLPDQVEQAVRTARKGAKPEVITRAVRQAVREVAFLFYLQLQVNTRLWGDWRAMCLHLAYVASEMGHCCADDAPTEADLARVRQHAIDVVLEFLQWDIAIGKLADRYYGGASPLFPAQAEQLAAALQNAEQVVTIFNDHLDYLAWQRTDSTKGKNTKRKKQKLPPLPVEPIDLEELQGAIQPAGIDLASHIVVMAQAEAAEFLGEYQEALALVRTRLWPGTSGCRR